MSSKGKKVINIEKFEGSFSTEQGGCSIFINSTINFITEGFALGIYTYLMCRPEGWMLNAKQLAAHFGCNKDKIYKSLNFLKDLGLLTSSPIREKGKFLKLHYMVHLHPQNQPESQLNKEISPRLEKPDVVKPDVEKADAYKTKNIQNKDNKKTTTTNEDQKIDDLSSSSDFIINEKADSKLLQLRDEYLPDDVFDRNDREFLKQCSHHLDNGDKTRFNFSRRFKGLESIIKAGFFETPAGYNERKVVKSMFTPEEVALIHKYSHALRMVELGAKLKDYMPDKDEVKKAIKLLAKAEKLQNPV
jgi:hypothetical protein